MKAAVPALLAALAAVPAHATRPSYSYFEAAYLHAENDSDSAETQGPRIGLSISQSRAWYLTGEYDQQRFDGSENRISTSALGLGVHSLKSRFQIFLAGTYERLDFNVDDPADDTSDEGFGAQIGFRLPAAGFEIGADAKYMQVGPGGADEADWRWRGSIQSRMTRNIAAIFGYETFQRAEIDQVTAGLRVYFDTGHDAPRRKNDDTDEE